MPRVSGSRSSIDVIRRVLPVKYPYTIIEPKVIQASSRQRISVLTHSLASSSIILVETHRMPSHFLQLELPYHLAPRKIVGAFISLHGHLNTINGTSRDITFFYSLLRSFTSVKIHRSFLSFQNQHRTLSSQK